MANVPKPPNPSFRDDEDPSISYNRIWVNLLRIQRSTMARVARKLKAHGIDDPIWHEILVQVGRSGPDGIAMAQLEDNLYCQQYALSRHVSRLVKQGYILSISTTGPGRSKRLVLTDEGKTKNEKMWPIYADIIQSEFAKRMSTKDAYDLVSYLTRLYP